MDGGVTTGDGRGRAISGMKRRIINDRIFDVYSIGDDLCQSEEGMEGEYIVGAGRRDV